MFIFYLTTEYNSHYLREWLCHTLEGCVSYIANTINNDLNYKYSNEYIINLCLNTEIGKPFSVFGITYIIYNANNYFGLFLNIGSTLVYSKREYTKKDYIEFLLKLHIFKHLNIDDIDLNSNYIFDKYNNRYTIHSIEDT